MNGEEKRRGRGREREGEGEGEGEGERGKEEGKGEREARFETQLMEQQGQLIGRCCAVCLPFPLSKESTIACVWWCSQELTQLLWCLGLVGG